VKQPPEFIDIGFDCNDEVSTLHPPTEFRTIKSLRDVENTMANVLIQSLKVTTTSNVENEDSKCSFEQKYGTAHNEPANDIITVDPTQSTKAHRNEESCSSTKTAKLPPSQEKNYLKMAFSFLIVVIDVSLCTLTALMVTQSPKPTPLPVYTATSAPKNVKDECSKKDGFELCFQAIEGCAAKGCSCSAWINLDNGHANNCKSCELCDDGLAADCTNVLEDEGIFSCGTTKEYPKPESETENPVCDQQNDNFKKCMRFNEKCKTAGCSCNLWYEYPGTGEKQYCNSCELCETGFMADCSNTSNGDKFSCETTTETEPPKLDSSKEKVECNQQSDDLKICLQFDEKCKEMGCGCVIWYEYPKTGEKQYCNSCEFCETGFMADCSNTSIEGSFSCQ